MERQRRLHFCPGYLTMPSGSPVLWSAAFRKILAAASRSLMARILSLKVTSTIPPILIKSPSFCAIYRTSEHWITNTSRGGVATNCPVDKDLKKIALDGAKAVGGGVVTLDLFETKNGYLVNEVNYTMEYRNSISVTGVDIPGKIVDYAISVGKGEI